MKKAVLLIMALALVGLLSTCGRAAPEPEPDYDGMLLKAASEGDLDFGRSVQELMLRKAEEDKLACEPLSFDRLYLLSRAVSSRFGGSRYSDELRLCMGELLLNRLASPDFPDTLEEVVLSAVDEGLISREAFEACLHPDRSSAAAALRLLRGERMMDSDVVYMSSEKRSGVYSMFCSSIWGNTYFYKSAGTA